jgi:hypothetical protein
MLVGTQVDRSRDLLLLEDAAARDRVVGPQ